MKTRFFAGLFSLLMLVFWSCETQEALGPQSKVQEQQAGLSVPEELSAYNSFTGAVKVMTRNIYIGTDVDVVLSAQNPEDVPVLVAQAFQGLLATNFPERAMALAREIKATRPHLIGLQEVSLVRIQSPGDYIVGGTIPAEDVLLDYLEIIQMALRFYGLDYKVAGKVQNIDIELPMVVSLDPLKFDDIRLTDYDVILARSDVDISEVHQKTYQVNLQFPDLGIELPRGFVAVTAGVGFHNFRFVNTHLEPAWNEQALAVQMAQAGELMAYLQDEERPLIMVGDFNSQAPLGETYQMVTQGGYEDVWNENILKDNPDGFTYGHEPGLRNAVADFWERIDFVFYRDGKALSFGYPMAATVVGDEQENRTITGLWPSDHGGVVARLKLATFGPLVRR